MNALTSLLPRLLAVLAGGGAIAATPSVMTQAPASPIPATLEEAIMQCAVALGVGIIFFVRKKQKKDGA